jgi:hypothetical protein
MDMDILIGNPAIACLPTNLGCRHSDVLNKHPTPRFNRVPSEGGGGRQNEGRGGF